MRILILLIVLLTSTICSAYEVKWINRLEQFGSVDIDLVISDSGKEIKRVHKSFDGKVDLKAEAEKEIYRLENPEPVVEVTPDPTVEELKAKVESLQTEVDSLKVEKAELQTILSAEVIK
jgi:hypothetical protein